MTKMRKFVLLTMALVLTLGVGFAQKPLKPVPQGQMRTTVQPDEKQQAELKKEFQSETEMKKADAEEKQTANYELKRAPAPGEVKPTPVPKGLKNTFVDSKGADFTLIYSTASTSSPGVYETTLGAFSAAGTQLATISLSYQAMEYVDGTIYVTTYNDLTDADTYGSFDPETGVYTLIKSGGSVADAITMAWNPVDDNVYATQWGTSTSSPFGKIDVATGDWTALGNVPGLVYMAIDNDGVCYGINAGNNTFGTINLANGSFTTIATYSENINYIQDLVVDRETNELYWGRRVKIGRASCRERVSVKV
jgi:hypothetical protein